MISGLLIRTGRRPGSAHRPIRPFLRRVPVHSFVTWGSYAVRLTNRLSDDFPLALRVARVNRRSCSGAGGISPSRYGQLDLYHLRWPRHQHVAGVATLASLSSFPCLQANGAPPGRLGSRCLAAKICDMYRLARFALTAALAAAPEIATAQTWGDAPPPQEENPAGLEAGGLTPPGESAPNPYESVEGMSTERHLAEADEKDTGRGLEFFWINGEAGFEYLGLQTFSANNLVDSSITATTQSGLVVGGGLGLRLVFLTVGPRFRFARFAEWDHWTLDAELGLHIPIGRVEPYFTFAGGYAKVGALSDSTVVNSNDVNVSGWNLRGGGGIDIYVSKMFTVGAAATGELLFLTRPGVEASAFANANAHGEEADIQAVYEADGSSVGAAMAVSGVLGLHF